MKRLLPLVVAVLVIALGVYLVTRTRAPVAGDPKDAPPPVAVAAPIAAPPPPLPVAARSDGGAAKIAAPGKGKGEKVIEGAWGSALGQFGRRAESESNPEAPMAMIAGAGGEVAIVDQVNRRVQRFKDGRPGAPIAIGGDTVQDLAAGTDGRTVLLDRLVDKNIQVYGADGKLLNEAPLVGKGIPEGGGVTGVFADKDGIYVEREHGPLVRIADANGNSDPARPEMPGRPTRDGRLLISAAIADREQGQVVVRAFDRASGQPTWTQPVQLAAPLLHIVLLDSDRQGMVYLAAATGHESPSPPYSILDEAITVVRLGTGGAPRGAIDLPPIQTADETFRPLSVGDDGSIWMMVPGKAGMTVLRYVFP